MNLCGLVLVFYVNYHRRGILSANSRGKLSRTGREKSFL